MRRPERTLLYQLVAEHYPRFIELLADQGRLLPQYVQREFEDFLKCGRLEHGFLRVRCSDYHAERLVAFSCKRSVGIIVAAGIFRGMIARCNSISSTSTCFARLIRCCANVT